MTLLRQVNPCPKCGGYVDYSRRSDDPTCVNCGWRQMTPTEPKPAMPERTLAQRRSDVAKLAHRIGMSQEEYLERVNAGVKWCPGCRLWHAVAQFSPDVNKATGLSSNCRVAEAKRAASRRVGWSYSVRSSE